jgi:hypothetical protein
MPFLKSAAVVFLGLAMSGAPIAQNSAATSGTGPAFQYIGPLTFGPDDTLFAADAQDVSIYALKLGNALQGSAMGTKNVANIDQRLAALAGTEPASITITDMAVSPKSHNTFISVMRGHGANAKAMLVRVDGVGTLDVVPMEKMSYTKLKLASPDKITSFKIGQRDFAIPNYPDKPKQEGVMDLFGIQTVTAMAFVDGRLYVTGISNEEFASRLRSIPYPFKMADNGTGIEIYHGSHGQFETRSPIYSFVPYKINGTPYLIASYLCTPLVKIPIASLKPGADVRGETIAEFGNMNRPLDMIVYQKGGQDFILMSNNRRGVMKVSTSGFGSAPAIDKRTNEKESTIKPEVIPSLKGVEQLDLLDATHALLLVRSDAGSFNLEAIDLP